MPVFYAAIRLKISNHGTIRQQKARLERYTLAAKKTMAALVFYKNGTN